MWPWHVSWSGSGLRLQPAMSCDLMTTNDLTRLTTNNRLSLCNISGEYSYALQSQVKVHRGASSSRNRSFKPGWLKVNATDTLYKPRNHELAQSIGRRDKMVYNERSTSTLPVNAHSSPANTQSILKSCHCQLPLDCYETNCWLSNSKNP